MENKELSYSLKKICFLIILDFGQGDKISVDKERMVGTK